jgi:hypothetical protein
VSGRARVTKVPIWHLSGSISARQHICILHPTGGESANGLAGDVQVGDFVVCGGAQTDFGRGPIGNRTGSESIGQFSTGRGGNWLASPTAEVRQLATGAKSYLAGRKLARQSIASTHNDVGRSDGNLGTIRKRRLATVEAVRS